MRSLIVSKKNDLLERLEDLVNQADGIMQDIEQGEKIEGLWNKVVDLEDIALDVTRALEEWEDEELDE